MVDFHPYQLDNGLKVLLSSNYSSPFAYITVLYHAGSKQEQPNKTGYAHLFEHLMFSGTPQVPDFDQMLQAAGGENNAFTNSDYTHYYDVLPIENIDVGLFLEADRMEHLLLQQHLFRKEQKVVVEEFYETCLNMPYGDVWHHLYGLAYEQHPYQWPTIGKSPEHIEQAQLADVQQFYYDFYRPGNAIISVVAPEPITQLKKRVDHYFSALPAHKVSLPLLPIEPEQKSVRKKSVSASVPHEAIYLAFHIPGRTHQDYRTADIVTDIFSGGRSSRFYQKLYKDLDVFAHIDAYITGSIEPGLLIIEAKIHEEYDLDYAYQLIRQEIDLLASSAVPENELDKFLAIAQSNMLFSEVQGLNTAMNLAFFQLCGDPDLINSEIDAYKIIRPKDIMRFVTDYLNENQCSILYVTKTP